MRKIVSQNVKKILLVEVVLLLILSTFACVNAKGISDSKVKVPVMKYDNISSNIDTSVTSVKTTVNNEFERQKKEAEEKERLAKLEEEKKKKSEAKIIEVSYHGDKLTKSRGTIQGPSGKETYYNLNMSGVVSIMRRKGFSEAEYPYNVRADGAKCLGPYVMVAAHLGNRPRGSKIQTSLGTGIVCDTGGFAASNPNQIDIATSW